MKCLSQQVFEIASGTFIMEAASSGHVSWPAEHAPSPSRSSSFQVSFRLWHSQDDDFPVPDCRDARNPSGWSLSFFPTIHLKRFLTQGLLIQDGLSRVDRLEFTHIAVYLLYSRSESTRSRSEAEEVFEELPRFKCTLGWGQTVSGILLGRQFNKVYPG